MGMFRDYLDSLSGLNEAITVKSIADLKMKMRELDGYSSWTYGGDYDSIQIGFKDLDSAKAASNMEELTKFGKVLLKNKTVIISLNYEAKKAI